MKECCDRTDPDAQEVRGAVYQAYRHWCNVGENRYKPLGSTAFYQELAMRGIFIKKTSEKRYLVGVKLIPDAIEKIVREG